MPLESPESSSPIVTRAVAAALSGQYSETFLIEPSQRPVLRLLGYFPKRTARFILSRFNALTGVDPVRVKDLKLDDLINQRLADYAGLSGPFPAITTGAAMGGASANLSVAMGGPFLPQAYVLMCLRSRKAHARGMLRSTPFDIKTWH
jgi:hypothetical protein